MASISFACKFGTYTIKRSGGEGQTISDFRDNFLIPLLSAIGYHQSNIDDLFDLTVEMDCKGS